MGFPGADYPCGAAVLTASHSQSEGEDWRCGLANVLRGAINPDLICINGGLRVTLAE